MREAIDIYTKLIIAVISFIAPLIIYLLSLFSEAISVINNSYVEQIKQIKLVLQSAFSNDGDDSDIHNTYKQYKKKEKELKKKVRILEPKRQIKRIFPTLFLALVLIALYHFVGTFGCKDNSNIVGVIKMFLIVISVICSICGVIFLKNVAWAAIEAKEEIARSKESKSDKNIKLQPDK